MDTLTRTQQFTIIDCAECGILFAITTEFEARRRTDHADFYCPAGHSLSYRGPSKEERARQEAERRAELAFAAEQRARQEADKVKRQLRAAKAKATRAENRAKAALCPVDGCGRSFVQLGRHLHAKHPEFAHPEAVSS